jgi:AAA domain
MIEPDRDQIEIFVNALFRYAGSEGYASVRSFIEGDKNQVFRISPAPMKGGLRHLIDIAEDDARRAANDPKKIVFCPPIAIFADGKKAAQENLIEGLTITTECDQQPEQAKSKLAKIIGPPTLAVRSGGTWTDPRTGEIHDKLHLHWRLREPARSRATLEKLKQAREIAARLVDGDPTSIPINHPIRWPGSWHRKNTPRQCEIAEANPDQEIDLDTALAALKAAAEAEDLFSKKKTNGADQEPSGDWEELIAGITSGENFHNAITRLAMMLLKSGMSDGAAVNMLRAWMNAAAGDRDKRWQSRYDDIPRAVKTAREKIGDGGKEHEEAADDLFSQLRWHGEVDYRSSRPWAVQDMVPEVGAGLISGQWGTFKTFVAMYLAYCIMSGELFLGHWIVRRGGVLFLALEGSGEVAIRMEAVIKDKGGITGPAPFTWLETCPPLTGKNTAAELAKLAAKVAARMQEQFGVRLVLIVIDTVIAGAGHTKEGADNDTAASHMVMQTLQRLARAAGCFVFGVDHFGKDVSTGTRGASVKEGDADVIFALLADRALNGTMANTRLCLRKRRGGEQGIEFPFQRRIVDMGQDANGMPMTSLVLDWQEKAERPEAAAADKRWPKSARLLQRLLMTVLADAGQDIRPFADGPMVRACDVKLVRSEFYRQLVVDGTDKQKGEARRQAFHRAVKDAQLGNFIATREVNDKQLIWLTGQGNNA